MTSDHLGDRRRRGRHVTPGPESWREVLASVRGSWAAPADAGCGCPDRMASSGFGPDAVVWRPLRASRVALVVVAVVPLFPAVQLLVVPSGLPADLTWDRIAAVLALLVASAVAVRMATCYVALTATCVVVRNLLPAPRHVPYEQLRAVVSAYEGVQFVTRDRRRVTAWAVQSGNWREVTGRPGRMQLLAHQVLDRAPHAHSPLVPRSR